MRTLKELEKYIRAQLSDLYRTEEIQAFILILIEDVLGLTKHESLLQKETGISDQQFINITGMVSDLKKFKPIQYIVGYTYFYDLKLHVNPHVLIPRQETEELVDWVIHDHKYLKGTILDIGTGSGCIAIALAKNLSGFTIDALDVSEKALQLAKSNALLYQAAIQFIHADIFHYKEKKKYEVIISNPPYVRNNEKALMKPNVLQYEPPIALFVPDNDPLIFYRQILKFAKTHLLENGALYVEINEALSEELALLRTTSGFSSVEIKKDLHNKPRMLKIKLS